MMLMRNSFSSYHDMWYDEALQLAAKVGLKEAKPRTVHKQTTRANPPFKTISETSPCQDSQWDFGESYATTVPT